MRDHVQNATKIADALWKGNVSRGRCRPSHQFFFWFKGLQRRPQRACVNYRVILGCFQCAKMPESLSADGCGEHFPCGSPGFTLGLWSATFPTLETPSESWRCVFLSEVDRVLFNTKWQGHENSTLVQDAGQFLPIFGHTENCDLKSSFPGFFGEISKLETDLFLPLQIYIYIYIYYAREVFDHRAPLQPSTMKTTMGMYRKRNTFILYWLHGSQTDMNLVSVRLGLGQTTIDATAVVCHVSKSGIKNRNLTHKFLIFYLNGSREISSEATRHWKISTHELPSI